MLVAYKSNHSNTECEMNKTMWLYFVRSVLNVPGNLVITKASSIVFQLYSTTCKCELISETQKTLIFLNCCYNLISLNKFYPRLVSNGDTMFATDSKLL